ncbi:MAG: bifunctional phosphoribosylaminoimidazolecarboxamide formyltransferase/IMP cyclohydrolase [Spirochaetaceae bacterium]|nr:bifunctional phosphoribosylaminoimidazolecarboxamide formyltransferase/IMP cyclohydrolase [Spirochaetaceae bacterium]
MKRALISVYNKEGVLELAGVLAGLGWEILSTGGTAAFLQKNGLAVTDVASVTGFPECLGGRVKTLHPAIHAGLLAMRGNPEHMKTLDSLGIAPIDLVCVNLYPFFEKSRENLGFAETVEFIDIGGPSMLRGAAKNFQDVIVLSDPGDYRGVIQGLRAGEVPLGERRRLAGKVFNLTSAYDAAVSRFMLGEDSGEGLFPPYFAAPFKKSMDLRYGENAHQKAALYVAADRAGAMGSLSQIQGKELSYNNIRDMDAAWKAVSAFGDFFSGDSPSGGVFVAALKHNTPCGAARGDSVVGAYRKAFACDPVSIFGGIIGVNAPVDEEAAAEMSRTFLEVIVAPGFTEGALSVFKTRKNLRLVTMSVPAGDPVDALTVSGGLLAQTRDNVLFEKWETVTKAPAPDNYIEDMKFGMFVSIFAKSNAVLVVQDGAVVGAGAGQTNRIWAAEQALERARAVCAAAGAPPARILASDAFFPFRDCVDAAHRYGIEAIVQPGGSIRDQESIDACNEHGIAMVFTGARHFKH